MIAEDRYGCLKAVPELLGVGLVRGVEGEDQERAEVVEERPGEHLVRLKLL